MGQKVNPIGFRLAINRDWRSRWFATKKEMPEFLLSDVKIRSYVQEEAGSSPPSRRSLSSAPGTAFASPFTPPVPASSSAAKGAEIEKMTEDISKMSGGKQVKIDIVEIKTPELDAQLVAENVALQIERRISFRRAMKKAVQTTMDFGARGIKIRSSGRLGGAEISRAEWYREGKIPLQTLRQPIDYGFAEAMTVYGKIGIKCWVCHPEEGAPERERPGAA